MKQNVILKAAIAAAFGVASAAAFAGQVSANPSGSFAVEAIADNASSFPLQPFAYQFSSTFAASSPVTLTFTLTNGALFDTTSPIVAADVALSGAGLPANPTSATVSADGTKLTIVFTPTGTVASGATATVATGVVNVVNLVGALGTGAGGSVGLAGSVTNSFSQVIESGAAQTVAISASAFSTTYAAGPSAALIEVADDTTLVTGTGDFGANFGVIAGKITVKNAAAALTDTAGNPVDAASWTHNYTISGSFSADTLGAGTYLSTSAACAADANFTNTVATDLSKLTSVGAAAAYTTGAGGSTAIYVCYLGDGTGSYTPVTFTGADSATAATYATVASSGTLYTLDLNGAKVRVTSYLPSGFNAAGFQGFLRVVNSGNKAADIYAAVYDETTGVKSTPVKLGNLKTGTGATWDAATVDGLLGVASLKTTNKWQTLELTARTSKIDAQSLVLYPNGTLVNAAAIQGGASNGSNQ